MATTRFVSVVLAVLLLAAGCAAPGAGGTQRLSIATGGTGGVYYPYGGGMANVLSKYMKNTQVTAEVTSASVDNMKLIGDKKADLAFALGDTAFDAVKGQAEFKTPIPAKALATLYYNYTHIVTTQDSGINSVKDLKGKRVSTGSAGSGTEVIANRVLEAAGLDPAKDIQREQLGAAESAAAIKDRKIDAYFWSGGLPTSSVTDLGATPGIKLKLIAHGDVTDALRAKYGTSYSTGTIPAKTYPGQDQDVQVSMVPNVLVVRADMDENLAYQITKTLFEHQQDLINVHKVAKQLTPENAVKNSPLEFHPGAVKYFREKGVLK